MCTKILKVIWLVLSLAPLVYMIYFMRLIFRLTPSSVNEVDFDSVFRLHMSMILYSWLFISTYIIYIFKSSAVPQEKKALWAVVIFMGNMVSMPIFWCLYVWRSHVPSKQTPGRDMENQR